MTIAPTLRPALSTVVAAGTLSTGALPVHAGVFSVTFDTLAGPAMPGVSFSGSAELAVILGDVNNPGGAEWRLTPRGGQDSLSNWATEPTFTAGTVVNRVPESGTLALCALAAVGAGGATRRRKAG